MRLVIQRVSKASVEAEGKVVGEINHGLFTLVGFEKGDSETDAIRGAQKLFKIRLMKDSNDKINLTVKDAKGAFLVVSQFTLAGDISGGNRPSFVKSEEEKRAKILYDLFVNTLKNLGAHVATGSFGTYMKISCVLDGPVTILYPTSQKTSGVPENECEDISASRDSAPEEAVGEDTPGVSPRGASLNNSHKS